MTDAGLTLKAPARSRWWLPAGAVLLSVAALWWFWQQARTWPTAGLDGRVYRDAARALLDRTDIMGKTALKLATEGKHDGVVEILKKNGATK